MIRLTLTRLADRVSDRYGLSKDQRQRVRDQAIDRWTRFAREHRAGLQPLLNEFLEMRLGLEPPSKQAVQDWAERAMPLFEKYRREFKEATTEFSGVLTPLQRTSFEVDRLQYGLGIELAERKLNQWQRGDFDPNDFWQPPQARRPEEPLEPREAQTPPTVAARKSIREKIDENDQETEPSDQITLEVLAWKEYVETFIRIYRLDEAQRDAVRSCFAELKDRALAHRDSHREEIEKLESRIQSNSGTRQELRAIKKQLVELYGPIDAMFQELKRRIEPIPTAKQRAAAQKTRPGSKRESQRAQDATHPASTRNAPPPPAEPSTR